MEGILLAELGSHRSPISPAQTYSTAPAQKSKLIARKPVPQRSTSPTELGTNAGADSPRDELVFGETRPDLDEQIEQLQVEDDTLGPALSWADDVAADSHATEGASVGGHRPSKLQTAVGEVKHFAGGLISHPYEATKHYSILRHSHGLVYYTGPTTSVAITVFSDQPLPPDRQLWLQKRGFSGRTGMKVGAALGSRSAWINVTPTIDATADLLPPDDERAWQRDISKFLRKAGDAKHIRNQRPHETDVVRIPHVADDGYFRIVLCAGRKVLCPSPAFRYATTSLSPGQLRGASLSTLPLELGIKLGAYVARNAANTAAHGAVQPVMTAYQNTVQPVVQQYNPMGLTRMAAQTAYDESGASQRVQGTVQDVAEEYDSKLAIEQRRVDGSAVSADIDSLLVSNGPGPPFPLMFSGVVLNVAEEPQKRSGLSTIDLVKVPQETLLRLSGYYVAWAYLSNARATKRIDDDTSPHDQWCPALVVVESLREGKVKVVESKQLLIHLASDETTNTIKNAKVRLMLMAFLRSPEPPGSSPEETELRLTADVAFTRSLLSRPAWAADNTLSRMKSEASDRSLTERIADAQDYGRRQLARVPTHRVGIKTDLMAVRDALIGNGGICVKR